MSGSADSSTHPARVVREALETVRAAPTILDALRRVAAVAAAAADDHAGASTDDLRAAAHDRGDALVSLAAIHALAALPVADTATLVRLLGSGDAFRVEHAAWALHRSAPATAAMPALVELVASGGVTGMLAQRTLEHWAPRAPEPVLATLQAALSTTWSTALSTALSTVLSTAPAPRPPGSLGSDDIARTRLVETVGLVPGAAATALLLGVVDDDREALSTVAAATAALGDWFASRPRRGATGRGRGHAAYPGSAAQGLTVAQLFLHADIDGELSSAGKGDTGGIATLLVHLGNALLESGRGVERVVTISRGRPDGDGVPDDLGAPGHHYAQVPLWGPPVGMSDAWMHRIAVRRGVTRILQAAGHVDAIHLRMADVGSFAAAEAARQLGVPVVFTVAPDPHALLASREAAGELTRESFAQADAVEHLTFRDHLVRASARDADQLVLFPRPELAKDSLDLLGLDLAVEGHRATVVAEGIDFRAVDRAGAAHKRRTPMAKRSVGGSGGAPGGAISGAPDGASGGAHDAEPDVDPTALALAQLDALLSGLPVERRGLPLAITVGRLNRVKGMATLVETWRRDDDLHARCNLLVVGGDLEDPSGDEAAELARIDAVVPRGAAAREGLLLPGHRPHSTVAAWLAATLRGRPGSAEQPGSLGVAGGSSLAGPAGVYVSASLKEEFGLAILEAMAAGLVVVAPAGGGPATYVEPDVTGVLTDTAAPVALAGAIGTALDMASSPETAMRQRRGLATLRERFSITTMAGALGEVYASAAETVSGDGVSRSDSGPRSLLRTTTTGAAS